MIVTMGMPPVHDVPPESPRVDKHAKCWPLRALIHGDDGHSAGRATARSACGYVARHSAASVATAGSATTNPSKKTVSLDYRKLISVTEVFADPTFVS